jgi:hypothetical protein
MKKLFAFGLLFIALLFVGYPCFATCPEGRVTPSDSQTNPTCLRPHIIFLMGWDAVNSKWVRIAVDTDGKIKIK